MKPQGFTEKKKPLNPQIQSMLVCPTWRQNGREVVLIGKRLQQSMLRYPSSAPESGQIQGSEPKAAASSEICLCYHSFGQTRTSVDKGPAGTGGQENAKAHTVNAARLQGPMRLPHHCDQSHPHLLQKRQQTHYVLQTVKKGQAEKIPPEPSQRNSTPG